MHGHINRYEKLFKQVEIEKPEAIFMGGDLLPHRLKKMKKYNDFTNDFLFPHFYQLKKALKEQYPQIFLILGNDDAGSEEEKFLDISKKGYFHYANQQKLHFKEYLIFGYSFIPPTPFQMKDWERYDVSRYVDPGCTHPTEGYRTIDTTVNIEYSTIRKDLETLIANEDVSNAIFLFHSPPYKTLLDRAALDGMIVDHVPLDVNVGSIAIKRFIEEKQPLITLHGHIHESTRITGSWQQQFGKTIAFNAAHDGPELALIKFDIDKPEKATRILI